MRIRLLAGFVALVLLAACGDDSSDGASSTTISQDGLAEAERQSELTALHGQTVITEAWDEGGPEAGAEAAWTWLPDDYTADYCEGDSMSGAETMADDIAIEADTEIFDDHLDVLAATIEANC